MKKLAVLLLGALFISALPCEAKSGKKIYVDPQNVKVTEDGVFILENDTLVPVKFVGHNEEGIFVKKQKLKQHAPCPACGFNGTHSDTPRACPGPHCEKK